MLASLPRAAAYASREKNASLRPPVNAPLPTASEPEAARGPLAAAARAAGAFGRALGAVAAFAATLAGALLRRTGALRAERRHAQERSQRTLPSLYELHPEVRVGARRARGVMVVPLDGIVGTERNPSQNTADFLPLPQLRGHNWRARWQRITRAMDRLAILPPVSLLKVGDQYFVSDGHNRVAAALRAGAVGIDAEVTELVVPGHQAAPASETLASSLADGHRLRDAASGRLSRTAEADDVTTSLDREDILRATGPDAEPPGDHSRPQE